MRLINMLCRWDGYEVKAPGHKKKYKRMQARYLQNLSLFLLETCQCRGERLLVRRGYSNKLTRMPEGVQYHIDRDVNQPLILIMSCNSGHSGLEFALDHNSDYA